MLEIFTSLQDFSFEKLMRVYEQSNALSGTGRYADLSPERQVQCAENDFYEYLHSTFFRLTGSLYCVWVEDGQYLSALRLEPFSDGYLLQALETAPMHRRKGIASQLVQGVLDYLAAIDPKTVYSHIHKRNKPSLLLHKKCGFRIVSDHAAFIDGTVSSDAYTLCFEMPKKNFSTN